MQSRSTAAAHGIDGDRLLRRLRELGELGEAGVIHASPPPQAILATAPSGSSASTRAASSTRHLPEPDDLVCRRAARRTHVYAPLGVMMEQCGAHL